MGVLLEGLKLPDGNPRTINIYRDGTWVDAYTTEDGKAFDIREPHGKLIDDGVLFEEVFKVWGIEYDASDCNTLMELINDTPAVIPASTGKPVLRCKRCGGVLSETRYHNGKALRHCYSCHSEFYEEVEVVDEELKMLMRDAVRCWKALEEYKEVAEQHEFPKLLVADMRILPAWKDLKERPDKTHARIFIRVMAKFLKEVCGRNVEGLEAQA